MKTAINPDSIHIDGEKLKVAREAKNFSISEIALSLTLSRAQVIQLEEGGEKSFYTLAHKLLATRKYATALGLAYDDVVSGEGANQSIAAPEEAPPAMQVYAQSLQTNASELRFAAVARNALIRRRTVIGLVVLCVLLALFAKVRGMDNTFIAHQKPTDAQGETPVAAIENAAAPASPEQLSAAAEEATPDVAEVARAPAIETNDACPAQPAGGNLKSWSPATPRKSDTRLFVVSPKEVNVCIADASGKAALYNLKPMVVQSFSGKPPYTVRSSLLASLEIYLQGRRVNIPSETLAIRLIPSSVSSPPVENQGAAPAPDA
jgi:cytoskeletal protein RodZ